MLIETSKKRVLLFVLMLFSLFCLLVPRDLQAAEQGYGSFWYGPKESTVEGVKYIKTGVVASNKYDAALYALGFSKSTVTGISNVKKNKLKADSTFSSFANKFKTGKPDDDAISLIPGVPTVGLNANSMLTAWYAANAMYGESNCYWSIYSKDSVDSAKSVASTIIKSGDEVGGGNTPEVGESVTLLPVSKWYENDFNIQYVMMKTSDYRKLEAFKDDHENYVILAYVGGSGGSKTSLAARVIAIQEEGFTFYEEAVGASMNRAYSIKYQPTPRKAFYMDGNGKVIEYNGKRCFDLRSGSFWEGTSNTVDGCFPIMYRNYGDDTVVVDPDPPVDWPTPDPDPITPPTPPDPIEPDPPTPWTPIPDIDIDITGDDFQDLLDALNEHCIHLQTSITNNISQLWQLQSDLFSDHMNTFWDNLHNDLLWLGECLNFDVNVNVDTGGGESGGETGGDGETNNYVPFDDSSVIYWLKQIWSKLGDGISIKPVDPVVNPNGWWDWFANLLGGLIGALADIGLDKIGGLVDALDTLKDKFPFCIPWDIAALLGLLVSEPVTPVVQVPLMALSVSNGVQQVGSMTIDLEPYDDVWEAVRWIERIAFCVYLATRTKDFLDLLGKIKG